MKNWSVGEHLVDLVNARMAAFPKNSIERYRSLSLTRRFRCKAQFNKWVEAFAEAGGKIVIPAEYLDENWSPTAFVEARNEVFRAHQMYSTGSVSRTTQYTHTYSTI